MTNLKQLFKEFLGFFFSGISLITLMLASFLILVNVYHSNEIKYQLPIDLDSNESYQNFKKAVADLDDKVTKANINTSNLNLKMMLNLSSTDFKDCLTSLKESKFYNMDKNIIGYKDVYDYNQELLTKIQTICLFKPNMTINDSINQYNLNNVNYTLYNDIFNARQNVLYYSNYLNDKLLSNSNYYYTTEITKNAIYNEVSNYFNLNVNNYNQVVNNLTKMINWYVDKTKGIN